MPSLHRRYQVKNRILMDAHEYRSDAESPPMTNIFCDLPVNRKNKLLRRSSELLIWSTWHTYSVQVYQQGKHSPAKPVASQIFRSARAFKGLAHRVQQILLHLETRVFKEDDEENYFKLLLLKIIRASRKMNK